MCVSVCVWNGADRAEGGGRCLTLTKLDASCNGIGVAGAEALCAGAAAMRRLAELDLRNNRLSGDAGKGRLRELVGGCAARVRFCLRD